MSSKPKIIQVSGILDGTQGGQIREEITTSVLAGSKTVLVDLEQVSFMDSSGLGSLVASLKAVRSEGAELYLCSVANQVQMLLELTSMNQVFKILPNRNAFLETVGR